MSIYRSLSRRTSLLATALAITASTVLASGVTLLDFDNDNEYRAMSAPALPTFNQYITYPQTAELGWVIHAQAINAKNVKSIFLTPQYYSEVKNMWVDAPYNHDMPKKTLVKMRYLDKTNQYAPTRPILLPGAAHGDAKISLCSKDNKATNLMIDMKISTNKPTNPSSKYAHQTWIVTTLNDAPTSFQSTGCTATDSAAKPVTNTTPVATNKITFTPTAEIGAKHTRKRSEPFRTHTFSTTASTKIPLGKNANYSIVIEGLKFAFVKKDENPTQYKWMNIGAGSELKVEGAVEVDIVADTTPALVAFNENTGAALGVTAFVEINIARDPKSATKNKFTIRFPISAGASADLRGMDSLDLGTEGRVELRYSYVLERDKNKKITWIAGLNLENFAMAEIFANPEKFLSLITQPASINLVGQQLRGQFSIEDGIKSKTISAAKEVETINIWGKPMAVLLNGIGETFPQAWARFTVSVDHDAPLPNLSNLGAFNTYVDALAPGASIITAVKGLDALKNLADFNNFARQIPNISNFNPTKLFNQYSKPKRDWVISRVLLETSNILVSNSAGVSAANFNPEKLIVPKIGENTTDYKNRLAKLYNEAFKEAIYKVFTSPEMWAEMLKDNLTEELRQQTQRVVKFIAAGATTAAGNAVLGAIVTITGLNLTESIASVPGYTPPPSTPSLNVTNDWKFSINATNSSEIEFTIRPPKQAATTAVAGKKYTVKAGDTITVRTKAYSKMTYGWNRKIAAGTEKSFIVGKLSTQIVLSDPTGSVIKHITSRTSTYGGVTKEFELLVRDTSTEGSCRFCAKEIAKFFNDAI
jgi:hypothetical protein